MKVEKGDLFLTKKDLNFYFCLWETPDRRRSPKHYLNLRANNCFLVTEIITKKHVNFEYVGGRERKIHIVETRAKLLQPHTLVEGWMFSAESADDIFTLIKSKNSKVKRSVKK